MESQSSKNSRRVMLLAGPVLLLGMVLLLVPSCGPSPRKPFVGVWRLDAKYFKEQLEKQEFKSDDAKAASDQNPSIGLSHGRLHDIPTRSWFSILVELRIG